MREHIVGVRILKVYTNITLLLTWKLQSWHKGNCTASAHYHSLWQTAQCESHPVRAAQAVGAALRDFPLTWRRNTQIQLYWLWKWLESYNNCTFSTWKDTFLCNLSFWIPKSFCTFHDDCRGGTPFLTSPDGPSLIFYYSDFWTTVSPWKTELPWNFSLCWNIFCLSGLLSNLCLPWKNEFALNSLYCVLLRRKQSKSKPEYRVFHNCWNKAIGHKSRILNDTTMMITFIERWKDNIL